FAVPGLLVLLAVGTVAVALALFGRLVGALALVGLLVLALFLIRGIGIVQLAFGHQIEVAQQHLGGLAELVLIFVAGQQVVQRLATLVLDLLAPQIDQRMARRRHRHPGQLFAQQQAQRLGNGS